MWAFLMKARKGNPRNEVNPYNPSFKVLIVALVACAIIFCCTGCAGWTSNAKEIRIQIPALLDMEFEYNEEKGVTPDPTLKEIFKQKKKP